MDAFYRLPVKTAGWALTGARCLARAGSWDCQADYRRTEPGASNDSFLGNAPDHWKVDFPSIDLARPNWTFASAALRLDQYVPDSIRYNDRHLLSRFQSISSAFTRLHLGKPVLLAVAAPRNKHGAQIARPTHSPRYFTRAFRAEGPLRSGSLLLPYVSSIEWKKISIEIGRSTCRTRECQNI